MSQLGYFLGFAETAEGKHREPFNSSDFSCLGSEFLRGDALQFRGRRENFLEPGGGIQREQAVESLINIGVLKVLEGCKKKLKKRLRKNGCLLLYQSLRG